MEIDSWNERSGFGYPANYHSNDAILKHVRLLCNARLVYHVSSGLRWSIKSDLGLPHGSSIHDIDPTDQFVFDELADETITR